MVDIGVIVAGTNADEYLALLNNLNTCKVVGYYNSVQSAPNNAFELYQINNINDIDLLIEQSEALFIFSDETSVFAEKAIKSGKHIYVHNIESATLEQASELVSICQEANVKCMLGYTDRFNAAYNMIKEECSNLLFLESNRNKYSKESNGHVVLELMLHDIDLVLSWVKSEIKQIAATGIKVLSDKVNFVNARLEFTNGFVANLTASRILSNEISELAIFQNNSYFHVDLLSQEADATSQHKKKLEKTITTTERFIHAPSTLHSSKLFSLQIAFEEFINSILKNSPCLCSPQEHLRALDIANKIIKKVNNSANE